VTKFALEFATLTRNVAPSAPTYIRDAAASRTGGPRALSVRAGPGEGGGAAAFVRRGALGGFSVEFTARAEWREGAPRVIERAELTGLALVDRPA